MTREEAIKTIRLTCPKISDSECDFETAMRFLIPELRESEDERIRKELIELVNELISEPGRSGITVGKAEKYLAYLEKQKEQKSASTEDMPYVADEHFYEQEPVDSFKYRLAEYMTKNRTGYSYNISSESILKMAEEELLKRGELQKPAESISQPTVQGKGVYKICPRCKERMVRDDSMVYTSMPPQYGYECPKCGEMEFDTVMYDNPEMEEQKSAEWSKNDTVFLNEITDYFENKTVRLQHDIDMYAHWLKSLPERFVLQPKQEWSEEDEKIIQSLILEMNKYVFFAGIESKKIISFLKSLRLQPKQELSEDVKKTLDEVSHILVGLNYKQIAKDYKQAIEKLLYSRPSWKPSEEQMEALEECGECKRCIKELYEQLNSRN